MHDNHRHVWNKKKNLFKYNNLYLLLIHYIAQNANLFYSTYSFIYSVAWRPEYKIIVRQLTLNRNHHTDLSICRPKTPAKSILFLKNFRLYKVYTIIYCVIYYDIKNSLFHDQWVCCTYCFVLEKNLNLA